MAERRRVAPVVLAAALCVTVAPDARGDSSEQLVQACYNAVNAGKLELACKLCEEAVSGTNDAHAKSAALMNLARCEESRGQLSLALEHYRGARALMLPNDVRAPAVDGRMAELGPRIGRMRLSWVNVPAQAELRIEGVVIEGRPAELAIDPGERKVELRVPGHRPRRATLHVSDGAIVALRLQAGPKLPPPPEPKPEGDAGDGQRIGAFVLGGLGVAGMIAFGITGGLVLDRQSTVDELCPEAPDGVRRCNDARGLDTADEGRKLEVVNAVSLGVGGVGLAAAAILYFTAPSSDPEPAVALGLSASGGSISFTGRF